MKIALVSQEYPPETANGGIGTQTYMRAHGLSELGHQMFVISHGPDQSKHEYMDGPVLVSRIPGYSSRLDPCTDPAIWLSYSMEVAVAVKELHDRFTFDLIVFPEYGGEGFVHLLNQTPWNHIPCVVHSHGPIVLFAHTTGWPELDSEFFRVGAMMEGTSLRIADAVSASSACSAKWCIEHYGLKNKDIPVLITGIDISLFYPRDVPKASRPTVIFAGGVRQTKGVRLLVEAGCILAKDFPDLQIRIVGSGDPAFIKQLNALAADAGFPNLLDFVGHVGRNELPVHLSSAHFFAGPSYYEPGPGNVYLEAMACGIPAIACSGSGGEEVVHHMQNGLLVPPKDASALAGAMRILLEDTELCRTLGNNGINYVRSKFESKGCIKRLEAFYTTVREQAITKNRTDQGIYA
jgi:glycosyltransferase involved in cell wall biosynthesis